MSSNETVDVELLRKVVEANIEEDDAFLAAETGLSDRVKLDIALTYMACRQSKQFLNWLTSPSALRDEAKRLGVKEDCS